MQPYANCAAAFWLDWTLTGARRVVWMLAVQPNMLVAIDPNGNVWKSMTVMAYFIVAMR
jgi:hypothetical protein